MAVNDTNKIYRIGVAIQNIGDMIAGGTDGSPTRIPAGTSGQVLTVGSDLIPQFANNTASISIGSPVTGGTPGSVPYVDPSGNLGQNNPNFYWDAPNSRLGLVASTSVTTLTLGNGSTGITIGNTADQTTNYERLVIAQSANIYNFSSLAGGTGTVRAIKFLASSGNLSIGLGAGISAGVSINNTVSTSGGNYDVLKIGPHTFTNVSGATTMISLAPTYNQASGTGSSNDILINRTETALGSGTHNFINCQVAGITVFQVAKTGLITLTNQTTTVGAAAGTLTNAPTAGNPTGYLQVSINGVTGKIPYWT